VGRPGRPDDGRRIALAAEDHAYDARVPLPDLGQQFRPIHAGHAHVADHDIDGFLFQHSEGLRSVAGGDHRQFGPLRPQHPGDAIEDARLVIDEEDPSWRLT
jgi:hypothetical protein